MGLYKRGNIWWFSVTIKGKQFRFSTKTTDRKKATEIYAKALLELDNPTKDVENQISFGEFFENQYLPFSERQASHQSKKYYFKVIPEWFKKIPINQITTRDIELLQGDLLKGRTPASVNRIIATIKHSLRKAYEWELTEEETLKRVQRVKPLKGEVQRLRFLSLEECHKLIEVAEPHLKPIIITALNTGMRKGEILSLTWSQIDLKHGFIHLEKTKNGERRDIPMNDTLKILFRDLIKNRRLDSDYVFLNPETGKRLTDIKRSFRTACKRAGITDFRFHDLRHTFASHLIMNGVDLKTVQELLGHKTIKMTLKYSHLSKAHKEKAVNTLNITIYHNFITVRQERG
ncbi:tyrosine-type recombinase/integrase [Thermodesulfovibrio yellowstonii]|uniref:Site specific recombinase n=1 Tax=Thermodesulfovibrio yellowstonii (strain ATCC 51303 / DSM 11347 / YP87) TaxID=289376 RepID=B5YIK4_THEYD|nr:site-specific integrase [Thermodesulfovibrio yellowstonii]ACI20993.1 site specific recombinase [Thermodesulfovibrio yellowstonii DSM 11347]